MSHNAMIFAWVTIGCAVAALALAFVIYIEEDTVERFYGNGKESGFRHRDDPPR